MSSNNGESYQLANEKRNQWQWLMAISVMAA